MEAAGVGDDGVEVGDLHDVRPDDLHVSYRSDPDGMEVELFWESS